MNEQTHIDQIDTDTCILNYFCILKYLFCRYRMVGVEELGEWHLQISNISVEDDGRYQCQVGATDSVKPIR